MSAQAPLFVVCEDGDEYSVRFTRLLGATFRFVRVGCFADALAACQAGEVRGLLFDLDFRRTPAAALVDESGTTQPVRPDGERRRLAAVQGILVLRALRNAGVALPAVLFADLDDAAQAAALERTLAPLAVLSSSVGLAELAARLRALAP